MDDQQRMELIRQKLAEHGYSSIDEAIADANQLHRKAKPPMALRIDRAKRSTGFQRPPTFTMIVSGRDGWMFDIPFQVDVFRRKEHTQSRAIAVAQLIFSFLCNPDDESVQLGMVQAMGSDFLEQLYTLSKDLELDRKDAYFWARIADGDRKAMRHRGRYFDISTVAAQGAVSGNEKIEMVDFSKVAAIATL